MDKKPYVTVYKPIAGWKAVLLAWDEECEMMAPWSTSPFAFGTREEAVRYAQSWAEAEEIELKV